MAQSSAASSSCHTGEATCRRAPAERGSGMLSGLKQRAQEIWSKRPALLRGRALFWSGGAAFIVLIGAWSLLNGGKDEDPYRTAAVDRGAITRVVSATGTLQPLVSA